MLKSLKSQQVHRLLLAYAARVFHISFFFLTMHMTHQKPVEITNLNQVCLV